MARWITSIRNKRRANRLRAKTLDGLDPKLEALDARLREITALVQHPPATPEDSSEPVTSALRQAIVANWEASRCDWPHTRRTDIDLNKNTSLPTPPLTNRERVLGKENPHAPLLAEDFTNGGFEHLRAVVNIAETMGITFDKGTRILDWGVGCARIARHLPADLQERFVGADVDPVNVEWCQQNIPFGHYVTLDPYEKTPFEDGAFDLIFSHSVMTHLSEPDQDHWLAELGRITSGLMILSVHGPYSSSTVPWSENAHAVENWLVSGFINSTVPNPDIADVTDPEYYRDVAHTPAYIRAHWSKFVDVLEILPRGFGLYGHDAVVCAPKKRVTT